LQAEPGAAVSSPVDDQELAVAAIAEMLLEDRARTLGVGARDREGVRQQGREPGRREASGKQDNEPESENRQPEAQDETRPARHASTLVTPGTLGPWRSDATSSTPPRRSSSSSPISGRSFRSRA